MKIIDKITDKEVQIDFPNTIQQMQNFFGCKEECRKHCTEAYKLPVWSENSKRYFRRLCDLTFTNESK